MQVLSYRHAEGCSFGILRDTGVVDLGARCQHIDLRAALAAAALPQLYTLAERVTEVDFNVDEIEFLPPIAEPRKIICIGVNYQNRHEEYRDGTPRARFPSVFIRTRESLVGHLQTILRPPESVQLDYEGEIVIVMGRGGRRIPQQDADTHIAGLTLMNEGTIRDWTRHAKFNVTQGKNFAASGAVGPWFVSADACGDFDNLVLTTRVNGEQRQHDSTANLMFPFNYLVHYLSIFMPLYPGDLIATGTPNGAGVRLQPPCYLQPGDVIEVHSPAIGTLCNTVADEQVGMH